MFKQKIIKEKLLYLSLEGTTKKIREHFNRLTIFKDYNISLEQWFILEAIGRQPGIHQKSIIKILRKEPASVSRMVNKLISRGFIERSRHMEDKKVQQLLLIEKGLELFKNHKNEIDKEFREIFNTIYERELYLVMDILKRIE